MNERIRELAEEAGLLGPSSRVGDSHSATEKFSELLVDECIKEMTDQMFYQGIDLGSNRGYDKAITKVEAHFGIEDKAEEFENWCKESDDGAEE